jgi:FkbH-like protein
MDLRNHILAQVKKTLYGEPRLLVVHSSFSSILPETKFEKWDAIYLIKTLILEGWTVVFPSFTFGFAKTGEFDKYKDSSETGPLASWILETMPEANRTNHPIYSFVIIGQLADTLTNSFGSTTFSDDSPFGIFEKTNARMLILGSGWNSCTQIHRYEEQLRVPYRFYKTFNGKTRLSNGSKSEIQVKMFVRNLELNPMLDMTLIAEALESSSSFRKAKLFRSEVLSIDVEEIARITTRSLEINPFALLKNSLSVQYKINLIKEKEMTSEVRIAILGNTNSKIIENSLISCLFTYLPERKFEFFELPFGQLITSLMDINSNLNLFKPEFKIFINRIEDLGSVNDINSLIESTKLYVRSIKKLHKKYGGLTLIHEFFTGEIHHSFERETELKELCKQLNTLMREDLQAEKNIIWLNVNALAHSESRVYDSRLWYIGKYPFSKSFSDALALVYTSYLIAYLGKSIRLVVLDLDNTLWGGVLGEDGINNLNLGGDYPGNIYLEFQNFFLELKDKGVALAIASKNDEGVALEAIEKLQFMRLKREIISSYRINWKSKWENIIDIASELNLGLSSVMFVDDNEVERNQVAHYLPEVKVLNLPSDPAIYLDTLKSSPFIRSIYLTEEDKKRVKNYELLKTFKNNLTISDKPDDYLKELGIIVYLDNLSEKNIQRAVQLSHKTNQFNTTTKRYNLDDLKSISENKNNLVLVIGIEDRYMAFENIGLIILKDSIDNDTYVDLFLLSCRVLGRGLEHGVLSWILNYCLKRGVVNIYGEIINTARNTPVQGIFRELGFKEISIGEWHLKIDKPVMIPHYLEIKELF